MKYIGIIILLATISGYAFKITVFLHWWVSFSFFYGCSVIDGGDQINAIICLLLIPVLLFDSRNNHWEKPSEKTKPTVLISIVSIWIIRLQISLLYFQAAISKFNVPEWSNGTAMYYWLNNSVFGMPNYSMTYINYLLSNPYIITIVTYSVLVIETTLFLCIISKMNYRKIMLTIGIVFHILIVYFLGIFSFSLTMIACLIIYLYPYYRDITYLRNVKFKKN